jgi:hypothetical protein
VGDALIAIFPAAPPCSTRLATLTRFRLLDVAEGLGLFKGLGTWVGGLGVAFVRILIVAGTLILLLLALDWAGGLGWLGSRWGEGIPTDAVIPASVLAQRARAQRVASAGVPEAGQILFGDLHVHSTFSTDAFMNALPVMGGDGARPVSDACDFARFCSALDFWSINDHAENLTPRRWSETIASLRQCEAVSGDAEAPDVVPFLGWEWTQVGTTPENHWGHKNVVFEYLDDANVPTRPISAGSSGPVGGTASSTLSLGLLALAGFAQGGADLATHLRERLDVPACAPGVPVRDLPADCLEAASTPAELFAKLDDWGYESIVIPHGTTWGYTTPPGASWDGQLSREQHDPLRQILVEVYSGHGNSEEYRSWNDVIRAPDGSVGCPRPRDDYLPSCWRAGEIARARCLGDGQAPEECSRRAARARADHVASGLFGSLTVPDQTARDWGDSGQCRDCFLPAFNYRPKSSVQYIMALSRFDHAASPLRFRFGFIASSDSHSARPGTGYKEYARSEMTEVRFGRHFPGQFESERQASFFLTGGLVAAHASGRTREAIWEAFQRREVYGTSGPRILLWFDLIDPDTGERRPMGSEVRTQGPPTFQVRALGSFEQRPGCPEYAARALSPERLERLCRGECYHPGDTRRAITRIEVVRIRPQARPGEAVAGLIEDPWKVLPCDPDPAGCRVSFEDTEFPAAGRDTLYYARAIEAPSLAVGAAGLGCLGAPEEDDCLGEVEERAWSSPIFVDYGGS